MFLLSSDMLIDMMLQVAQKHKMRQLKLMKII